MGFASGCAPVRAVASWRHAALRAARGCPPDLSTGPVVLTASNRLRSSADFLSTTRNGVRVAKSLLVAHFYAPPGATGPARIGFTVSSAVGGSVVRHHITRQLRVGCQVLLPDLPGGSRLVIRALPPAAQAPAGQLQSELRSVVRAALAKAATK